MTRKALVTGGAGYIGSQTVLALRDAGWMPVVVDNLSTGSRDAVPPDVPFFEADISDVEFVRSILLSHHIDCVLHFAGSLSVPESVEAPLKYYSNNVAGSIALLQACLAAEVRHVVFSSTAAIYGEVEATLVNEDAIARPINPYGASKLFIERALADIAAAHRISFVALRYFNVAGADPYLRTGSRNHAPSNLIGAAIDTALGLRGELAIFGTDYPTRDGTCERDFIHVADLAAAHVASLDWLMQGGASMVVNCGYGRAYSVREVIRAVEVASMGPLPLRIEGRRPGDPARVIADATRIQTLLNWRPQHAELSSIIASALAWRKKTLEGSTSQGAGH